MKQKSIILIGGGGHCKSCIEVIESAGEYHIAGIIDVPEKVGDNVLGYKVIGHDAELDRFVDDYNGFLVTAGQIKSPSLRKKLSSMVVNCGGKLLTVRSEKAIVSRHVEIQNGSIIMHHAVINAGAKVGKHCIINTKALIEHDASIGDFCHVSTGSIINGDCIIGSDCMIGSGSIINQGVNIGNNCLIASGTVVRKNVPDNSLVFGNPMQMKQTR